MAIRFDGRWPTASVGAAWNYCESTDPATGNGTSMTSTGAGFTDPNNANQLAFVTSPRRRSSGFAARLRVGGSSQSERLEFLRTAAGFVPGSNEGLQQWWAWSVYVTTIDSNPKITVMQIFSQYNASMCGTGNGAHDIYMAHPTLQQGTPVNRWNCRVMGGLNACAIQGFDDLGIPIITGEWIDFLAFYKWSSGPTGITRVWWRRPAQTTAWTQVVNVTRANLVSGSSSGLLAIRHGCYRVKNNSAVVEVVLGGLVVADTQAEAENAAFEAVEPPPPDPPPPPITGALEKIKQATNRTTGTAASTLGVTVPTGGMAAGNTAIVMVVVSDGRTLSSVTDSRGNAYTVHRNKVLTTVATTAVASSLLATALQAGDTITLTFSSAGHSAAVVVEYQGILGLDVVGPGVTFSNDSTPPGDTITTTKTSDLILGVLGCSTGRRIATPGSGFTDEVGVASTGTIKEIDWQSKIGGAPGSESTVIATASGSATGTQIGIAFEASPASADRTDDDLISMTELAQVNTATIELSAVDQGMAPLAIEEVELVAEVGGSDAVAFTESAVLNTADFPVANAFATCYEVLGTVRPDRARWR